MWVCVRRKKIVGEDNGGGSYGFGRKGGRSRM